MRVVGGTDVELLVEARKRFNQNSSEGPKPSFSKFWAGEGCLHNRTFLEELSDLALNSILTFHSQYHPHQAHAIRQ